MFCPKCGYKADGEERFCAQCGTPLGGAPGGEKGVWSRWLKTIGIVGAVVIVVVTALLIGRVSPNASPDAVVTVLMEAAYVKGDAAQLIDVTDPGYLEQVLATEGMTMVEWRNELQAELDEMHRDMEEEGGWISFEVGNTEILNGRARVAVTIAFGHPEYGDEEATFFIYTVRRDGRWYVEEWPE